MDRKEIQNQIRSKGFTQTQVARLAGIRPARWRCQILCDILAGRRPGYEWRPKIAEVLGVPEDLLFKGIKTARNGRRKAA